LFIETLSIVLITTGNPPMEPPIVSTVMRVFILIALCRGFSIVRAAKRKAQKNQDTIKAFA
jgi:hypothetical protein